MGLDVKFKDVLEITSDVPEVRLKQWKRIDGRFERLRQMKLVMRL